MSNGAVRLGLRLIIGSFIHTDASALYCGHGNIQRAFLCGADDTSHNRMDSWTYNGRRIYLCSSKVQGHMRSSCKACGSGAFGGDSSPCCMGSDKIRRSLCLQYNIFLKMKTGRYILYRPVFIYSLSLFSLSSGLSTVIFSLIILFSSASRTFSVKTPSFTSSPACGIRPKSSSAQPPRV